MCFGSFPSGSKCETIEKIAKQVPSGYEWGYDGYSLKVENFPQAPPKPEQMELNL
jgi:hypothetical protein